MEIRYELPSEVTKQREEKLNPSSFLMFLITVKVLADLDFNRLETVATMGEL